MTEREVDQEIRSFFAGAKRRDGERLQMDIETVSNNPVITGLLTNIGGLLAVLNEYRQIVALNTSFLEMLGLENIEQIIGLRPGEAVGCVYAHEEAGGCGTSKYCSTCGAAIAIVTSLQSSVPVERRCALTAKRGNKEIELALQVRANPIRLNGRMYVLLFLQDITRQEQRAALERTFFHDVNNMLSIMVQGAELLAAENPSTLSTAIYDAALRLSNEVAIQRCLLEEEECNYLPVWRECDAGQILQELRVFFASHTASRDRILQFPDHYQRIWLKTDGSSLFRVLLNMIVNGLEATEKGGTVRVWVELDQGVPTFCVWNEGVIPQNVARRVFQRNFSTKDQAGRGVGTYSMKLFGEKILGGKITFTSREGEGTIFRFAHPATHSRAEV